jgi:5-methylcytosine-specific restriction enzyme A
MGWDYDGPNLYSTARWQRTRLRVLARDCAECQMCGCLTTSGRSGHKAAEIDHRTPHKGNAKLFFDEANLWVLCKACHSTVKQREERGKRLSRSDGW